MEAFARPFSKGRVLANQSKGDFQRKKRLVLTAPGQMMLSRIEQGAADKAIMQA